MTAHNSPASPVTAAGVPRAGGGGRLGEHAVSRIGFGAMQLERLHDDRTSAIALVRRAVELGIDHMDTAQFYGNGFVNGALREALRPADSVTLVSKVGAEPDPVGPFPLRAAQRPEQLRAGVEDNLSSLGIEQIPIVNLRRMDMGPGVVAEGDQVVDLDDQLAEMTALRAEGKIGAIGLSNVTLDDLRRSLPVGVVCVQNSYSLVTRDDEPMRELCTAEDIAWVPYFPLGGAIPGLPKVTDEPAVQAAADTYGVTPAQVGLAWLLHRAPNVLLIPGTASPGHLDANVAAGDISFDDATLAALNSVESQSSTHVPFD